MISNRVSIKSAGPFELYNDNVIKSSDGVQINFVLVFIQNKC